MLLNQLRPVAGLLYRCSLCFPLDILLMLYNSFINSKLNYAIEAWGNAPVLHLNKLLVLQKKMLRIINKKPIDAPSAPLFKDCNVLNVFNLFQFKILLKSHSTFYSSNIAHATFVHTTRQCNINLPLPQS